MEHWRFDWISAMWAGILERCGRAFVIQGLGEIIFSTRPRIVQILQRASVVLSQRAVPRVARAVAVRTPSRTSVAEERLPLPPTTADGYIPAVADAEDLLKEHGACGVRCEKVIEDWVIFCVTYSPGCPEAVAGADM